MTVGSGILWSTVLVVLALTAYQLSVRQKWRVVGKIVGGLILVALVAGGGLWAWNRYENRPRVVEILDGVRLGMSPLDVKLAKGVPTSDDSKLEGDNLRAGMIFRSYESGPTLVIVFEGKDINSLKAAIVCEYDGYSKVLGLGRFDSEEVLTAKLGPPTKTSIAKDGLSKLVSFKPYKIAFALSKGQVDRVCITESGSLTFQEEYQAERAPK